MKVLKLTTSGQKTVYVFVDQIQQIKNSYGWTEIYLTGGKMQQVVETPEEILETLNFYIGVDVMEIKRKNG